MVVFWFLVVYGISLRRLLTSKLRSTELRWKLTGMNSTLEFWIPFRLIMIEDLDDFLCSWTNNGQNKLGHGFENFGSVDENEILDKLTVVQLNNKYRINISTD